MKHFQVTEKLNSKYADFLEMNVTDLSDFKKLTFSMLVEGDGDRSPLSNGSHYSGITENM